jgi:hypothetical protein
MKNLEISIQNYSIALSNRYNDLAFEYMFNNLIALRMGYKGLFAIDSEQGFNYGGGIRYEIGSIKLKVDYSNISFGVLNSVNLFIIELGL